jgi:hypothetical protein
MKTIIVAVIMATVLIGWLAIRKPNQIADGVIITSVQQVENGTGPSEDFVPLKTVPTSSAAVTNTVVSGKGIDISFE